MNCSKYEMEIAILSPCNIAFSAVHSLPSLLTMSIDILMHLLRFLHDLYRLLQRYQLDQPFL